MRKKANKAKELKDALDDKFIIYQIDKPLVSTGRKKFKPSKVASPYYGSKVIDKRAFPDNAGKLDVDYGYDYVRRNDEKHISEEELIKRHGTKYYEFGIENPNYPENNNESNEVREAEKPTKPAGGFVTDLDSFIDEDLEVAEIKINPIVDDGEDYLDENNEFNLNIEEAPEIRFNDIKDDLPEPTNEVHMPDFLGGGANNDSSNEVRFNDIDDNHAHQEPQPSSSGDYYNPAVDRNITIEEAIRRNNENYYGFKEEPSSTTPEPSAPVEANKPKPPMKYEIPYRKFLPKSESTQNIAPAWLEEKKEIINQTLKDFSIDGEVINYTKGPAFTLYEILLAPGVNVKKVNQIFDNLQMNLRAKSLRILLPIPGKNTIGVEAPNDETEMVKFGDILNDEFINDGKPLRIALGKYIDGTPVYQDIEDMPHALIAGATKSGKSVCMNTILLSLLLKNSPEDLKLILVDPKKVELTFYSNIPHLATPVILEPAEATEALRWATVEMDRRFDVLARNRCKQLKDYNKKQKNDPSMEKLPYIVCVVDEFNDLVMQSGQEVTDHIVRLAQKGRAAGIHVILATQRPTVDVVSGTIKANIACRIAFKVASSNDSSIILDETGAEQLLGRGDMLFKNNDAPFRAQGAFIEDDEIESVCNYIADTYTSSFMFTHDDLRQSISKAQGAGGGRDASGEDDELLYAIASFCIDSNSCSINSIQNHFGLGFNRASRIVTLLEEMNIVSPKCGTKSREILVDSYKLKEIFGVED